MRIGVFGSGYVGLVTGVCFAEMGNDVVCVDIDVDRIEKLSRGISPIYEPGLSDLIQSNSRQGRLTFSTDLEHAVKQHEILFVAVGTPSGDRGAADLSAVYSVARTIGKAMDGDRVVVIKSTVPVGTGQAVERAIRQELEHRGVNHVCDVVSNPEFLKEGTAIADCLKPDRIVVGCSSPRGREVMSALYHPFLKNGHPLLFMDVASSELTKYAANAMLATKISLMNEISRLCERVGADVENVRQGIGTDQRIGHHFIYPGLGYGGSCFPKDVRALIQTAASHDEDFKILQAVEATNQMQRERFCNRIENHFNRSMKNRRIALWGLAFKPNTDDTREAPALYLIDRLTQQGAEVVAFDPVARRNTEKVFAGVGNVRYVDDQYEVVRDADALCVITEWKQFREPDFAKIMRRMRSFVVFDGRNIYCPDHIRAAGGTYYSIGRPG